MSNSVCMLHTDRPATAFCAECNRPLCPECTQTVAGKPICQSCITAIRSRVATQLNAEAAQQTAAPAPPSPAPYGTPGYDLPGTSQQNYPPQQPYGSQQPGSPNAQQPYGQQQPYGTPPTPYGAQRTDLAGNPVPPASGAQYAPPQGAPGAAPPPYGAQPGYGTQAPNPYGQQGYGQQTPPAQPGYNPYGTQQTNYPPQQPGYSNTQQPYGNQNRYPTQSGRPLSAAPPATSAGNYVLGAISGLIAAVIGAIAYIAVVRATGFVIGYMALGVGFLVGWAVKLGTRAPSQGAGIMAAVLSVLGILPCEILTYDNPSSLLFTALFLFIGCRWAYGIAASGS